MAWVCHRTHVRATLEAMTPPPPPPSTSVDVVFDRLDTIPIVDFDAYGSGTFRRRIRLVNLAPGHTAGELEDDFHHFRVDLSHDGTTIRRADGTGYRGPWSSCFDADAPLRAIEGHPLSPRSTAIGGYTDATSNCTHLFDLTGLAVAHATRTTAARQYDLAVADLVDGRTRVTAWRDGVLVLDWRIADGAIEAPAEWVDAPLRRKFIPWAEATLDPDLAEAAIALRRVVHISMGRAFDLDIFDTAESQGEQMYGKCHTYTVGVAITGRRNRRTTRDFAAAEHAALLLADMHLRTPAEGDR